MKGEGTGENRQRHLSLPIFATHCLGLPLPGSPLVFLHPQLPCCLTRSCPHPSEERRGRCSWLLLMALQAEVNQRRRSGHVQKCDAMSRDHDLLKVEMSLSPTTYLSVSSTSITCAPPSKDVGRECSSMPLKQHGRWRRLPLPSPSALPRHLTLSIENASPSLLTPSSAMLLDVEH